MESASKSRFLPYARRVRQPAEQPAEQPSKTKKVAQRLSKPLAGFVKRSLKWFGYVQAEQDLDSDLMDNARGIPIPVRKETATIATSTQEEPKSRHCKCGREADNEPSERPSRRIRVNRSPTATPDDKTASQRGYSQEQEEGQEKPKKKRNIHKIPGRFSALDSSDKEEDQRQHHLRVAERRAAQKKNQAAAYNSPRGTQEAPLYHIPPQIYPTLQYGVRTKLYNPKLYYPKIDGVLKQTASPPSDPVSLDTWKCPKCEQHTKKTLSACQSCKTERSEPSIPNTSSISTLKALMKSDDLKDLKDLKDLMESFTSNPIVSAAISAAPAALEALTTAGVSVGAFKAILDLVSELKDWETQMKTDASKAHGLLSMTTPTPPAVAPSITSSKDADNGPEKEKEKPKSVGTWASIGFKGPDNTGKWKCDVCYSHSLDALDNCGACQTPKPGAEPKAAAAATVPNMFAAAIANAASSSSSNSKPAVPTLFSVGVPSSSATPVAQPIAPVASALLSFGPPSSTPASSASAAPAVSIFAPPAAKPISPDAAPSVPTVTAPGGFAFKAPSATPATAGANPTGSLLGLTSATTTGGDTCKAPSLLFLPTPTATSFGSAKSTTTPVNNPYVSTTAPIVNPFTLPATFVASAAASALAPTPFSLFGSTTPASAFFGGALSTASLAKPASPSWFGGTIGPATSGSVDVAMSMDWTPSNPSSGGFSSRAWGGGGGFTFNMGVNTPTPGPAKKITRMRKRRN
ncbi:hypothetical protein F5H01DRAFT_367886 [Linnemannia elongata]|nr:hypothetical protein F5H01DRAFT_367886 [Linnemannia elongata]